MAPAACRHYINSQISGDPHTWPIEWLRRIVTAPIARALSIGCGTGALERGLLDQKLCTRIDAFDASIASLSIARAEARRSGYGDSIHYFAADFNTIVLPRS